MLPDWAVKLARRLVALAEEGGRFALVLTFDERGGEMCVDWSVLRIGKVERP
jgi:hypothetical protein